MEYRIGPMSPRAKLKNFMALGIILAIIALFFLIIPNMMGNPNGYSGPATVVGAKPTGTINKPTCSLMVQFPDGHKNSYSTSRQCYLFHPGQQVNIKKDVLSL